MRRMLLGVCAMVLCVGCAKQTTAADCVLKVDVLDAPSLQLGSTRTVSVETGVKSGDCPSANFDLTWSVLNVNIVDLVNSNNTSASLVAKKAGSTYLVAWLTRTPTVRDSIQVSVFAPTDTNLAD